MRAPTSQPWQRRFPPKQSNTFAHDHSDSVRGYFDDKSMEKTMATNNGDGKSVIEEDFLGATVLESSTWPCPLKR